MSGVCSRPRCESRLETFAGDADQPHSPHQWPEDSCPGNLVRSFESISEYSLQSRDNSGKHFVSSLQNPDSDGASAARYWGGCWGRAGRCLRAAAGLKRAALFVLSENRGRRTSLECCTCVARVDGPSQVAQVSQTSEICHFAVFPACAAAEAHVSEAFPVRLPSRTGDREVSVFSVCRKLPRGSAPALAPCQGHLASRAGLPTPGCRPGRALTHLTRWCNLYLWINPSLWRKVAPHWVLQSVQQNPVLVVARA